MTRFLGKRETLSISFDTIGSRSWLLIDGIRDVSEIGACLDEEMGESVKPLYERLSQFMLILARHRFIRFKETDRISS